MNTSQINLTRRYILALALLAVLSVTGFVILNAAIRAQRTWAAVINVSGRQRMLSQRIARFALLYTLAENADERASLKNILTSDLTLFEESHNALIEGGSVRGLSGDEVLLLPGSPSTEVENLYFGSPSNVDNQVKTYISEAKTILNGPTSELTVDNPHLQYLLKSSGSDILIGLNTVTGQYQIESEAATSQLQVLEFGVVGATLLAIILTGFLIFRPMVQQITKRTQELLENVQLVGRQNVQLESRARAIALSAEVSRRLSVARTPRQLAVDVVEQVQEAFKYYHAHIYFVDEATGDLIMAGGTGDAGAAMLARGHKVPKGRGLVGRAAETNAPVLVPDVSKEEGWLSNPLLPETQSEAAVPITAGAKALGVLDVQQNTVNGLAEADVEILQLMAGQVAISMQNARAFEESRARAELESLVGSIGQKIQRSATVEEALQTAVRELGTALGASRVKAKIQPASQQTVSTDPVPAG